MKLLPWLSTLRNRPGLTQVVNTQFEWVKESPEKSGWWICCNFPGSVDSHRQWNGCQKFHCTWYSTTWCHCFVTKGCRWWADGFDPRVQRLVSMHRSEWHSGRWLTGNLHWITLVMVISKAEWSMEKIDGFFGGISLSSFFVNRVSRSWVRYFGQNHLPCLRLLAFFVGGNRRHWENFHPALSHNLFRCPISCLF